MQLKTSSLFLVAAAMLAGCATQPSGPSGKFLVYREFSGKVIREFEYPTEEHCKRVEAVAGGAKCQLQSVAGTMPAEARLLYNPPGFEVLARYSDMERCRIETAQLGAGVRLMSGCAAK